jgi:uncharacterized membrane protein
VTGSGPRSSRTRIGLDSNVVAALAYVFGPIGAIVCLLIEKHDNFVRFHALQSIVTFIGIGVLRLALGNLPLLAWTAGLPLWILAFAVWMFLIVKALLRERYKIPVIGDFVERQLAPRAR